MTNLNKNEAKKNFFFEKKKFKMADSKKLSFSTTTKSWAIFAKISQIGPWVSRIDWCEGHWFGLTYMVVRLSVICSKTGKKYIFCAFRPFLSLCRPASRPHGLSKINALCINQSYYPKDESMKFWRKLLSFWRCWQTQFFWVGHFDFFMKKKKKKFASFQ